MPPVGFELETNGFHFCAIANLDKTSLLNIALRLAIFKFIVSQMVTPPGPAAVTALVRGKWGCLLVGCPSLGCLSGPNYRPCLFPVKVAGFSLRPKQTLQS